MSDEEISALINEDEVSGASNSDETSTYMNSEDTPKTPEGKTSVNEMNCAGKTPQNQTVDEATRFINAKNTVKSKRNRIQGNSGSTSSSQSDGTLDQFFNMNTRLTRQKSNSKNEVHKA